MAQQKSRTEKTRGFLGRAAAGLSVVKKEFIQKDFGAVTADGDIGWRSLGGSGLGLSPNSDVDWQEKAGDLLLNSVVSVCLQFVIDKIAEPQVRAAHKGADGLSVPVPNHPAANLMQWANPEYRGRQLLAALAVSYKLNGNAYAVKVRGAGGLGTPRELWYVPHWLMTPLSPLDGGPTEFYAMRIPGKQQPKLYPRADVIHLRNGLDLQNRRLGMSSFRAQFRAVVSDNEIDTYTALLLSNFGLAGVVITPDGDDVEIDPVSAEELKRRMTQSMTGDSRGDILVPNIPVKIQYASRSPQDLALGSIGDRPMQRICATFGIDPAAVGLAALTGEKYGTLRKEARASSYEQGILPMLAVFAEAWTQELLPDFLTTPSALTGASSSSVFIEYDFSGVKDMQEDNDAKHKRAREDFKANGLTLNEFRAILGLEAVEDEELGEKFQFQLLPAPGGDVGVPGSPGGSGDTENDDPLKGDDSKKDEKNK